MTLLEKMVWANAYTNNLVHNYDVKEAISFADLVVKDLRSFVEKNNRLHTDEYFETERNDEEYITSGRFLGED